MQKLVQVPLKVYRHEGVNTAINSEQPTINVNSFSDILDNYTPMFLHFSSKEKMNTFREDGACTSYRESAAKSKEKENIKYVYLIHF